jgi:hypothetical protein
MGFDRVYPVYYEISFELETENERACKTRHSLIFTGDVITIKLAGGGGKHGCIAKMQNTICHGEYIKRQINILTMERKAIGSVKSV